MYTTDEDWDEWQGNDHDAHVDDPDFNVWI